MRKYTDLELLERAVEELRQQRDEECWCYDLVDGAPDSGPPGWCIACHYEARKAQLERIANMQPEVPQ